VLLPASHNILFAMAVRHCYQATDELSSPFMEALSDEEFPCLLNPSHRCGADQDVRAYTYRVTKDSYWSCLKNRQKRKTLFCPVGALIQGTRVTACFPFDGDKFWSS